MHRSLALLLCSLLAAFAAFAAPAPVYKPDRTRWLGLSGWDKPTDPRGGSRFAQAGEKLTITVPSDRHHGHDHDRHLTNAPRLLRGVRGDFDVRVRVGGRFLPASQSTRRVAGLVLAGGEDTCYLERSTWEEFGVLTHQFWGTFYRPGSRLSQRMKADPRRAEGYMRMERLGEQLTLMASEDGFEWYTVECKELAGLPPEVKVGVFAAAADNGPFEAAFDQFSLTPLK
jgi:hypothetical protein